MSPSSSPHDTRGDQSLPADLLALRRMAVLLDHAVPIPGTRAGVGIDALVGLIPGVGDLLGAGMALGVVYGALRHRVPWPVIVRMLWHIFVDAVVGVVPVFGNVFDVLWQGNLRNMDLVVRHRDRTRPPRAPQEVARTMVGIALGMAVLLVVAVAAVLAGVVALLWAVW